jgi:hypothetical protein
LFKTKKLEFSKKPWRGHRVAMVSKSRSSTRKCRGRRGWLMDYLMDRSDRSCCRQRSTTGGWTLPSSQSTTVGWRPPVPWEGDGE